MWVGTDSSPVILYDKGGSVPQSLAGALSVSFPHLRNMAGIKFCPKKL